MPTNWDEFSVIEEPAAEEVAWEEFSPLPEPAGALSFPKLGAEPTLAEALRQPTPQLDPWQGGVVRSVLPGTLQPTDLVPAVRKIGGEIVEGEPGDTHPDIIKREDIPAIDIDQRGFAGPVGEFYDREAAAEGTQIPTAFEPGRLHSTDLSDFQEGVARLPGEPEPPPVPPPFEQPIITPQGPVYPSDLRAKLAGGTIGEVPETELSSITGIPPDTLERLRRSPVGRALLGGTPEEQAAGIPEAAHPSIMQVTMPAWLGLGGGGRQVAETGKVLGQAVGGAFLADFARQSPQALDSFVDAIKRKDYTEARNIAVEYGFGAVFATLNLLGLHQQFKSWDATSGNAGRVFEEYKKPEAKPDPIELAKEQIRRNGPTAEQNALFNRIDPEIAGTTYEKVVAYAESLGLSADAVVKPTPKPAPETVAPPVATAAESVAAKPEVKPPTVEKPAAVAPAVVEAPAKPEAEITSLTPAVRADDDLSLWVAGKSHADARLRFQGDFKQWSLKPQNEVFVDNNGKIYTRAEALEVFKRLTGNDNPKLMNPAGLSTEDFAANNATHLLKPEQAPEALKPAPVSPEPAAKPGTKIEHPLVGASGTIEKKLTTTSTPQQVPVTIESIEHGEISSKTGRPSVTVRLSNGESMSVTYGKDKYGNVKPLEEAIGDAIRSLGVRGIKPRAESPVPVPTEVVPKNWQDQFAGLPKKPKEASRPIMIQGADGKVFPGYSEGVGPGAVKDPVTGKTKLGNTLWVSRLTEDGQWTTGPIRAGEKVVAGEPHTEPVKPAEKPAAAPTPAAPPPAPKPTAVSPDIEKMLKVDVPDVAEAKVRLKAFRKQRDEVNRKFGEVDQQIRELEKRILGTRGYSRGKIKSGTTKADRDRYSALQAERGKLRTQMVTIDETTRADRDLEEAAQTAQIINDPKQPLLRRIDRLIRTLKDVPPELIKARDAETYRMIREKYPDATEAELLRIAPEFQRSVYFGEDPWKSPTVPTVPYLREHAIIGIIGHPDSMPFQQLPDAVKDKINRYTRHFRAFEPQPRPVEPISAAELEALRKEVLAASSNIRENLRIKEQERVKAEQKAAAAEERLLVEAQETADSAGKPGTPGGRSAKAVRDELVAKTKAAIDKVIAEDNTKIKLDEERTKEDEEGYRHYMAEGEQGGVAFGTVKEVESGKFEVEARHVKDPKSPYKATVTSEEEAKWAIKAMASYAPGKAIYGVPGDGVWRINRDGRTMLGVFRDAKRIDVSAGKAPGITRGAQGEKPPTVVRTAAQWNAAKEWHGLTDNDTIYDWSPALRFLAEHLMPDAPEKVTAKMVDDFIKTGEKPKPGAEPPAAAPTTKPTEPPPAAPPSAGGTLIGKERANTIRERLKKKLQERPGEADLEALEDVEDVLEARAKIDPSIFKDAVDLGAYYIQSGLHKFEPWAAQMRADFGEVIEPYLRSVYETARVTIESPGGEASRNLRPGLQPGLRPPADRIDDPRKQFTRKADESVLPPELVQHLDPHQRQGAATGIGSLVARGGGLIADGTGVGKTREALAVAHYFAGQGNKVIIITRAETIKPDWKKGTFGGSYFNDAKTMGVKVRLARDAILKPGEIGITTYENARAVEKNSDPNTILIWDESHSLKNKSNRGVAGDKANAKAKSVLFMSATPADKPEHIYYLTRMGIMEGKSEGQQLKDLGMMLVKMEKLVKDEQTGQMVKRTVRFWAPDPNIPEGERNARFNALFDRMTANGAMIKREISMQGVHVQVLKVALPPEAHETLQEILRFFEADTIDDLKGLKKAVVLMHLRRQQEPFKIAPTVLLAQRELDAGRQVVIFVSRVNESEVGKWVKGPGGDKFREVLMSSEGTAKALRDALHEAGIHDIAEIHGEADQASLDAMADFQSGKKRVVIATIESGGTGINLDDIVGNRPRTMIVVTAPFDAVGNVQAAGRIWRLKTMSGANMFYIFGDTEVDAWNADIIGSKMATLGAVVEGAVRRLDISNPEAVNTDDFHGTVKKGKAAEGGVSLPPMEWIPHTSKSGRQLFRAPAPPEFWNWYRAHGAARNPLGLRVGKMDGKWYVFALKVPEAAKPAAEGAPPPAQAAYESLASSPENGPGGEAGAALARHGTATGLPPDVPDGGPNFAQELMEAGRRLGTLVRSKVNLGRGILGRYVPARAAVAKSDKIEVGDIQNQATVAHEEGHDIDALLFTGVWAKGHPHIHSQASLVERIGTGNKKDLKSELSTVSVLMRGIMTGTPGYVRYRQRATELIADWYSLYVHDPARARTMAPQWTAGFEAELAKNPESQAVVRELHARNVRPVAPAGTTPTGPAAAGMPGAVVRPEPPPVARDRAAAVAAENVVKGTVRKLEAEVQKARIRAEGWRKQVKRKSDRNDVGAFIEGTGNLEIPGDTRDAVIARMTPEKMELAKQFRFHIELQRQRINRYLLPTEESEYLAFLEDYLPHFYVNSKSPGGREAVARFIKNSPNAKARKLPTLREAVEYGLIPITQDPTVLYEMHARINWRVATNRAFLAALKDMRTSAGEPIIVPAGQNPGGWPVSNNPLIQRVYAHATPGGLMLWRGGAAVHPDVWHAVRQILETPTSSGLERAFDAVNAFTRANAFAFSFFHDITLRAASLGAHGKLYNPLRGLFRILEKDPVSGELRLFQTTRRAGKALLRDEEAVADAALHGLKFAWTESESYQHGARDFLEKLAARLRGVPFLGKSAKFARDAQAWRQEGLWRDTHDAFKLMAYHDLVNKALATAPKGMDAAVVKQRVASLLNDAFGGQEWQTKFWLSPTMRRQFARFWLAPDWTISTLRSVPFLSDSASVTRGQLGRLSGRGGPAGVTMEGWKGNIGRARFWTAELAALAIATIAAQYAIYQAFGRKEKGDKPWVWENEEGQNRRIDVTPLMRHMPWAKEGDPTRYYTNLGKRPEEILHWFMQPDKNIQAKLARPLIEAMRQIFGTEGEFPAEWEREHYTFIEGLPARLKSLGGQAIPFTFSGNQFALSLPYRKGMTKYKAEQAFQSAYEVLAEPSTVKRYVKGALRFMSPSDTEAVLRDIRDAAERNGVPVEEVEKRARAYIRGRYYHNYFRAYQQADKAAMEKAADALERLGATSRDISQNIRLREKFEPIPAL